MPPAPLLSVVMPAWNAERFVADAIGSVLAQTVPDWELLVINDGSTDGTAAILADCQRRDPRIRVLGWAENRGIAHARNLGLASARGDLIAFLDSDDVWHPAKIARQVAFMLRERADISYTGYHRVLEGEDSGRLVRVPPEVTYRTMLRRNWIPFSTAMVSRPTCGAHRMRPLGSAEDFAYWLALLRDGSRRAVSLDQPLMGYRVRSDSVSANKLRKARNVWRVFRKQESFGRPRALAYLGGYVCHWLKFRAQLASQRKELCLAADPDPAAWRT